MSASKINYVGIYQSLVEIIKAQAAGGVPLSSDRIEDIHKGLLKAAEITIAEGKTT